MYTLLEGFKIITQQSYYNGYIQLKLSMMDNNTHMSAYA